MKHPLLLICAGIAFLSAGCMSISSPVVRLTGEKTLVENQIIGEYREIEDDAWAVSSVKTGVQRQKGSGSVAGDEIIFNAMKIRELHEERIRLYKNEGVIGESFSGSAVYRSLDKYEKDADLKRNLFVVLDEENKARRAIFERSVVLAGKEKPAEADIAAIGVKFAEEEKARAQKNDWIQESNGTWLRKK